MMFPGERELTHFTKFSKFAALELSYTNCVCVPFAVTRRNSKFPPIFACSQKERGKGRKRRPLSCQACTVVVDVIVIICRAAVVVCRGERERERGREGEGEREERERRPHSHVSIAVLMLSSSQADASSSSSVSSPKTRTHTVQQGYIRRQCTLHKRRGESVPGYVRYIGPIHNYRLRAHAVDTVEASHCVVESKCSVVRGKKRPFPLYQLWQTYRSSCNPPF